MYTGEECCFVKDLHRNGGTDSCTARRKGGGCGNLWGYQKVDEFTLNMGL